MADVRDGLLSTHQCLCECSIHCTHHCVISGFAFRIHFLRLQRIQHIMYAICMHQYTTLSSDILTGLRYAEQSPHMRGACAYDSITQQQWSIHLYDLKRGQS